MPELNLTQAIVEIFRNTQTKQTKERVNKHEE